MTSTPDTVTALPPPAVGPSWTRRLGAGLIGIVATSVVVALVETLSGIVWPVPSDLPMDDDRAMAAFLLTLPFAAYLVIAVGHAVGFAIGGTIAGRIAGRPTTWAVLVVFLLICVINLASLPHPAWFWPLDLGLVVAAGIGTALGLVPAPAPAPADLPTP